MDLNLTAFRIVTEATSDAAPNKAKRISSRKGGLKGGVARAQAITPDRRVEIARKASAARWSSTKTA